MATTVFRRDHLLRRIINPGTTAVDSTGRLTTSTLDYLGRALTAIDWPGMWRSQRHRRRRWTGSPPHGPSAALYGPSRFTRSWEAST
jgi:hypothetical protein